jgi:hypothetical protein
MWLGGSATATSPGAPPVELVAKGVGKGLTARGGTTTGSTAGRPQLRIAAASDPAVVVQSMVDKHQGPGALFVAFQQEGPDRFVVEGGQAFTSMALVQWLRSICDDSQPECVVLACPRSLEFGMLLQMLTSVWVVAFGDCQAGVVDRFVSVKPLHATRMCFAWLVIPRTERMVFLCVHGLAGVSCGVACGYVHRWRHTIQRRLGAHLLPSGSLSPRVSTTGRGQCRLAFLPDHEEACVGRTRRCPSVVGLPQCSQRLLLFAAMSPCHHGVSALGDLPSSSPIVCVCSTPPPSPILPVFPVSQCPMF